MARRRRGGRRMVYARPKPAFGWFPLTGSAITCNNVQWTSQATLFDGGVATPSGGFFSQDRGVVVTRLLIQLGAVIVTSVANTLYRIVVSFYVKDRDDASVYNINGANPFATDTDERIVHQTSRDFFSPAPASYGMDQGTPWALDEKVVAKVRGDELLMIHVWAGKMTPAWSGLTGVDQVVLNFTGRLGCELSGGML